jgi:hypothetical protein
MGPCQLCQASFVLILLEWFIPSQCNLQVGGLGDVVHGLARTCL